MKLILTVGLPRSGKSTWANKTGWPIVNRDSIRFAIGGSIRYFDDEVKVNEVEVTMVLALFKAGHQRVIVDATHLKNKYIDKWKEVMEHYSKMFDTDISIELQKFYTPLSVCVNRARSGFPEDEKFPAIIRSMWENAETIRGIPEFDTPVSQTLGYMRLIKGDL